MHEQSIGGCTAASCQIWVHPGISGPGRESSWAPDTTDRALTPLTKRRNIPDLVEQLFISHSVADRIRAPRGAWQWSQRRVSGIRSHSPAQRGVEIPTRF